LLILSDSFHIFFIKRKEPYNENIREAGMTIQLLELQQAEKLSACKISLSLGLTSEQNLLEQFLQFNRKLMQASTALLSFHQEPYLWHRCPEKLKAIDSAKITKSLNTLFVNGDLVDSDHPQYSTLLAFLAPLKKKIQTAVALHLRHPDQTSLGYIILFDEAAQGFSDLQKQLLQEHCVNFMQQLELKFNHDELKELYEQEAALNFSKTKFFSIISHDLRAPFHGLLGFSEILAKERETLDESSIQNIADYLYDTSQSTLRLSIFKSNCLSKAWTICLLGMEPNNRSSSPALATISTTVFLSSKCFCNSCASAKSSASRRCSALRSADN